MEATPVGSYNFPSGPVLVYDSKLDFPYAVSEKISQQELGTLQVPSTRFYYLGTNNIIIPFPSLMADKQTSKDLYAWIHGPDRSTVVYSRERISSVDPEIDLISITEGKQLIGYDQDYADEFLIHLRKLYVDYPDFRMRPQRRTVELLLKYPVNPGADFFRALNLTHEHDKIQAYLDEKGVRHFTAKDIENLSEDEIFFYLTRFYAPPPEMGLSVYLILRKYYQMANNERSRQIVNRLPGNMDVYNRDRRLFDFYFNMINVNPEDPLILSNVGATNETRFYNDFYNYLKIFQRPKSLPPLTLNTIRQLSSLSLRKLSEFLKDYSDQEIISLVGDSIDTRPNRREFIEATAEILLENQCFLLLPIEADLCNNPETINLKEFKELGYVFVGKGNIARGFDCYDISEVFASFEANKSADGKINFHDPLHYDRNFSMKDLQDFRDAFARGRGGFVPPATQIVKILDDYIHQMGLQSSTNYNNILVLRNWVSESSENKRIMSDLWNAYFRMGMYMRQWKGPGNPYPLLERETGREAELGTRLESEINENIFKERVIFTDLMNSLPESIRKIIWSLPIYTLADRQWAENVNTNIHQRYIEVIEKPTQSTISCIRMASAPWVYTAAFYLRQTTGESISGFPLSVKIDVIH